MSVESASGDLQSGILDVVWSLCILCLSGLPQDAVDLLQDSGLWRYAATLTASRLDGVDHAHSCQRWAQHVLSKEGSVWRSAGILVSGGCLQEAARVIFCKSPTHGLGSALMHI